MGKVKKNAIDIEADLSDGYKALGFVKGLTTEVQTDRYIGPVVEYAHSEMAKTFDEEIDTVARAQQEALGHVYEWRMTGNPKGRLWRHTLSGRGADRQASWQWGPSIMPILKPAERKVAGNPNDPMTNVSDEDIAKLSDRDYYFTWKAPVLEYGLNVNIQAVNAQALFIPTFNNDRGYFFAKSSGSQIKNTNMGKFTTFWTMWWNRGAGQVWDMHIKRVIEKDLGRSERELAKATRGRNRMKSFGISTITANDAAFEAGRNMAEAYIKGKAKSYRQAATYIEKHGRFGDEVSYPG